MFRFPTAAVTRSRRGFTLVELIVVIVILGLLAAVGAFGYSTVVERSRKSAARAMASHVSRDATGISAGRQLAVSALLDGTATGGPELVDVGNDATRSDIEISWGTPDPLTGAVVAGVRYGEYCTPVWWPGKVASGELGTTTKTSPCEFDGGAVPPGATGRAGGDGTGGGADTGADGGGDTGPVVHPGTCPVLSPVSATVQVWRSKIFANTNKVRLLASTWNPAGNPWTGSWHAYVVLKDDVSGAYSVLSDADSYPTTVYASGATVDNDSYVLGWNFSQRTMHVAGIQFKAWDVAAHKNFDQTKLPQDSAGSGVLGVTRPDDCLYYFGDKIASVAGNVSDEPFAALTP